MNKYSLQKSLAGAPETEIKVSAELHRDIMRAVRLARPTPKKSLSDWTTPAWVSGMAFTAVAVFYLSQMTGIETQTPQDDPQSVVSVASLQALGDKLVGLSESAPVPEEELRKELERLKSDLGRFDFRS